MAENNQTNTRAQQSTGGQQSRQPSKFAPAIKRQKNVTTNNTKQQKDLQRQNTTQSNSSNAPSPHSNKLAKLRSNAHINTVQTEQKQRRLDPSQLRRRISPNNKMRTPQLGDISRNTTRTQQQRNRPSINRGARPTNPTRNLRQLRGRPDPRQLHRRPQNIGNQRRGNQNHNDPRYLRSLDRESLRKEVIQTQIEIEKALIENQKNHLKGVSTIRDLMAPSAVKIETGLLQIGTKFIRSHFVLTYPRVISSGWLEGIVNADIPLDLSIFIYPRDSGEVLKELKGKVGKIQASLQINSEKGEARDVALETAAGDVESLRDAIQQGTEKFFRVGIYVNVYADTKEELERNSKSIEDMLSRQNIIIKRSALQMDDGFNSALPILKDDLNVFTNLNTGPLSASFPFVSSDLSSDSGILYGINRHNTSLVIFNRFELENANSVIFATSGAGKSYTVKLEILRSLMIGTSVIVIDPENEYETLANTVGGTYINMSLNSVNRINPFDLPKPLPGESSADILRSAIIDLMGLISLMVGELNPTESSMMERALKETYAKRDITEDSDLASITPPTMGDLVDILNGIVGGESLAQRLYRYTEGTFAGMFNQRTNINVGNNFLVFNIRDLVDQLRPIAMYILLKYIWNEIRSEKKQRVLVVDEAWIMMQNEDSAKFLFGLVKRARKYWLGVTTITQDVGDFLKSPYGRPIVTNSAMKILLKQSSAAIDAIGDIFALTDGEKQVLLQSSVGQGIFFAGPRHVAIEIIAFPTEHKIITTDPKEM